MKKEHRTHNSTYPKVAVQWLNQALCIYQSFCLVDSESLRNRHLRVAAKRWEKSPFGTIFPIGLPLRGRCETIVAFARLSPITRFARFFFESKLSRKTSQSGSPLAARWHDDRPISNLVMIVSPTATVPSFPMYLAIFSANQILPVFCWACFNFIPIESHPAANSRLLQAWLRCKHQL